MQPRPERFRECLPGRAAQRAATGENARGRRGPPDAWSIGAAAKHFGISPRAIRFYEERGLLTLRRNGTHRKLNAQDRSELDRLLRLRRMGFTVTEIRALRTIAPAEGAVIAPPGLLREHLDRLIARRDELDEAIALVQAALKPQRAKS